MRRGIDVRGLVIALAMAVGLGFFYLSQSSLVAATGYEIDQLRTTLAERQAQQQQLVMQIGQARSPAEIARRATTELHLVPLADEAVRFAPVSTQISD